MNNVSNLRSGPSAGADPDDYLEAQMNAVSRSFAVVVACLEQPLRMQFATAYLLCRVADNIEDCTEPAAWKTERFADFESLLAAPERAPDLLPAWSAAPWPGLTDGERKLMGADGAELWRTYAAISPTEREIIRRWVWDMADGMRFLDDPGRQPVFLDLGGVKALASPSDYNRYCYIVAGTVGHMATELVMHAYSIDGPVGRRLLEASETCGRALQKTNILKDFAEDLERGVCYLPDEWLRLADRAPLSFGGASPAFIRAVFEDVLAELAIASQYVLELPLAARDYRQASLLCLFPALQTNLLAVKERHKLFTSDHHYKISRLTLSQCMLDARRMAGDNAQIQEYSRRMQEEIRRHLDFERD